MSVFHAIVFFWVLKKKYPRLGSVTFAGRMRVRLHHDGGTERAVARRDQRAVADDGVGGACGGEDRGGIDVCVLRGAQPARRICGVCGARRPDGRVSARRCAVARGRMGRDGAGEIAVVGQEACGPTATVKRPGRDP